MYSRIFQISDKAISKENYLNEYTLDQGDFSPFDYCSEIDDGQRKRTIVHLAGSALPEGMFELLSDDTIRYNGSIEQWNEEYVANIREKAEVFNVNNMSRWDVRYELKMALENPLGTDICFYLDEEACQPFAEKSFFMDFVRSLKPGTILHIGGVIAYRF